MCWAFRIRDTGLARLDEDQAILVPIVVNCNIAVMGWISPKFVKNDLDTFADSW